MKETKSFNAYCAQWAQNKSYGMSKLSDKGNKAIQNRTTSKDVQFTIFQQTFAVVIGFRE